jgi:hypothetical protein
MTILPCTMTGGPLRRLQELAAGLPYLEACARARATKEANLADARQSAINAA